MTTHVKVSGSYVRVREVHVKVSGTYRMIRQIWSKVSGVWQKVYQWLLETTITVGTDGVSQFGYADGLYGSIGNANFNDAGGNARTVSAMIWDGSFVQLILSTASIPNTDTTFECINIDGNIYKRSAATYNGSFGGGARSQWRWTQAGIINNGTITFGVI